MNDLPLTHTREIVCISKTNYCQYCKRVQWFTKVFGQWFCNGCHLKELPEQNNYAVFMQNKETGYTVHGDYVLTKAEAQEIADALNKDWPDHNHYVKQEGEA